MSKEHIIDIAVPIVTILSAMVLGSTLMYSYLN